MSKKDEQKLFLNPGCAVILLTITFIVIYFRGVSWESSNPESDLIGMKLNTDRELLYTVGCNGCGRRTKRVQEVNRRLACLKPHEQRHYNSHPIKYETSFEIVELLEIRNWGFLHYQPNYRSRRTHVVVLKDDRGKLSTRTLKLLDLQQNDVCTEGLLG